MAGIMYNIKHSRILLQKMWLLRADCPKVCSRANVRLPWWKEHS